MSSAKITDYSDLYDDYLAPSNNGTTSSSNTNGPITPTSPTASPQSSRPKYYRRIVKSNNNDSSSGVETNGYSLQQLQGEPIVPNILSESIPPNLNSYTGIVEDNNDDDEEITISESDTTEEDDDDDDDDDDSDISESEIPEHLLTRNRYAHLAQAPLLPTSAAPLIPNSSAEWEKKGAAQIVTKIKDSNGHITTQVVRKSIKDFKLGKELGEGSYSTVYLADDTTSSQQYAIKVLDKHHIIREKKVKYVNIEKNALNRLGARNGIIHLFFTFQDEQSLYFVLDYASNGELLTLIKKNGSMNEESVRYYSAQIIDAVSFMHENGVVHRDLKPENILINDEMKVQITDFGTAKILELKDDGTYPNDAKANSFVGTAEYVSPELLNDKYCGKPGDIWAIGCVIYQMIAGKPPFKATNEYLTFQKIVKLQYAFSAGFPTVVRDLVKRILVLRPKDRLTIPELKQHYFYKELDFNNEAQLWGTSPPELGPYKMSAKSMMSIPDLNKPYPSNVLGSMPKKPTKSSSTPNVISQSPSGGLGNNQTTIYGLPMPGQKSGTNSSPSLIGSVPLSAAAAQATTKKMQQQTGLTIQPPKTRSSGSVSNQPTPPNSARSHSRKPSSTSSKIGQQSQKQPLLQLQASTKSASTAAAAAISHVKKNNNDKIYRATGSAENLSSSSSTSLENTRPRTPSHSSRQIKVDLIPGTNIPRPTINTRMASTISLSKSNTRSKSSLTLGPAPEIPQMSVLDMNWVKFLKHPDERVIKVGLVKVSQFQTDTFEKRFRGMLTESPLGYKNRDLITNPNIYANPDLDIRRSSVVSTRDSDAITFIETDEEESEKKEEVEEASATPEKKSRFMNLFSGYKTIQALNEQIPSHSRTLLITTFGRALFFSQNHDRTKPKYELVCEVDLTNTNIQFKELISDRKPRTLNSLGTFAIVSRSITLGIDAEKIEISSWTNSLAKARFTEQERRLRKLIENDPSGSAGTRTGGEAAFAAANLASKKTPNSTNASPIASPGNFNSYSFAQDAANATSSKANRKPPPSTATTTSTTTSLVPPPSFPSSMRSTSDGSNQGSNNHRHNNNHRRSGSYGHSRQKSNTENDNIQRRIFSSNSPMISAAINKAISNATVSSYRDAGSSSNSTVNSNNNSRSVTGINSRLLARTRKKR